MRRLGGYWNKSRTEFRYRCQNTDHRLGKNATWSDEQIAFLVAHYPTNMAFNSIARETHHHTYEVKRKAEQLGLVRPAYVAPLKRVTCGGLTFSGESIETILGWLHAHGHSVTDGAISGTYKMSHDNSMTPQQVILFANNKRVRCGPEATIQETYEIHQ